MPLYGPGHGDQPNVRNGSKSDLSLKRAHQLHRHHDQTVAADERRDRWLGRHGVGVLRIAATDVLDDPDAVADWIAAQASSGASHRLPAEGGGDETR